MLAHPLWLQATLCSTPIANFPSNLIDASDASFWDEWNDENAQLNIFLKMRYPLNYMCSLLGFTKMNGNNANMTVIVEFNDFPREETQTFSLGHTKPIVVA
jgi:hypothetical protein